MKGRFTRKRMIFFKCSWFRTELLGVMTWFPAEKMRSQKPSERFDPRRHLEKVHGIYSNKAKMNRDRCDAVTALSPSDFDQSVLGWVPECPDFAWYNNWIQSNLQHTECEFNHGVCCVISLPWCLVCFWQWTRRTVWGDQVECRFYRTSCVALLLALLSQS
eukprot:COSAG02_NODE_2479_length_8728_cov_361.338741_3_plen_161_part_00